MPETESRLIPHQQHDGMVGDAALAETVPLPMLTVDRDGIIQTANREAEETLGVRLPGHAITEFAAEDEVPETSLCHTMQVQDAVYRKELQARRPDGRVLWLLASARRLKSGADGDYMVLFQDVTAQKDKERRLQEANEEAERNIRARMRFLAAASHDLRQPLQAMALFASALEHHVATPQGRAIVESLKTSLRGMEEMFDALLDMSKLDAGVMRADPQTFMISDILEQLEATYASQAEAAGLDLRVIPSSVAVRSDPRLLSRILANFLSNAIRYTRDGGVVLGVRHHGGRVRVAVYDTGPGIPENQRLDIFREFQQGSGIAAQGRGAGMGLGLSIVQRLARLLNHTLDVRSVVGRGSVFAVEVPLAEEIGPVLETEDDEAATQDISGAAILVLDDSREIRQGLGVLLRDWGAVPVTASSTDEALVQLRELGRAPDVILSDLHLGGPEGGVLAIETIRQGTGLNAPAILFTGDTGAPAEIHGRSEIPVLRKPLAPLRLRLLLASALAA